MTVRLELHHLERKEDNSMSTWKMSAANFEVALNFEVAKFDGWSDYLLWERQIQGVLKATGFGKALKPKPDTIGDDEWSDTQEIAVNTVMLYLQPQVIKQIDDHSDCASLFTALKAKYDGNNLSNRLCTLLKLMSFRMKEGGTKIQDHIDAFNDLVVDLMNLGEELSDEQKALHLLSSLPTSYQSLSWVLLHSDKKTITYNEVVSALMTNDLQQKLMPSHASSLPGNTLHVSRGRSQSRMSRRSGDFHTRSKSRSRTWGKILERRHMACWRCGNEGHIKRDCRLKSQTSYSISTCYTG